MQVRPIDVQADRLFQDQSLAEDELLQAIRERCVEESDLWWVVLWENQRVGQGVVRVSD